MIAFITGLLLISLALLTITLEKTYFYLPSKELKREAAHGDRLARILFQAAAYDNELKLMLWICMGLFTAGGFVLLSRVAPPILGFLLILLSFWLGFIWIPLTRLTLYGARIVEWSTPVVVYLMRLLHPVLRYASEYVKRYHIGLHTGLYEHEDLIELIDRQQQQSDNRMSDHELQLMRNALNFGHLKVRDVTTARRHVVSINADEDIGPVLLDELHKSGHPFFPVYEGQKTNIIGTLALSTVADIKHQGKVRDYYDHRLSTIQEGDSIESALIAFYETKQHLYIVVDKTSDFIGIITLSDILYRLFEASRYENTHHTSGAANMIHQKNR